MNLLLDVGHFFLSVWLWSISWGFYQAPMSALYMFLMLKLRYRMTMVQSVLIALGANLFAFFAYTALIVGILIIGLGLEYVPNDASLRMPLNDFVMCISLAVVYTLLQALLFSVLHVRSKINLRQALVICAISNGLAAWFVYAFLPVYR